MSLLNDALRDAEQRQTRPQVTGTYTGQPAVQPADTSKTPLIIGLLAILVLIGGAGTWWLLSDDVVLPVAETAGSSALVAPEPARTIKGIVTKTGAKRKTSTKKFPRRTRH